MNDDKRVYETRVTHVRRTPWRRAFAHRSWMWVVDVDAMDREPSPGRLADLVRGRIVAADHLDGQPGALRHSLERYLEREVISLSGGRVLLGGDPRAFGFCVTAISVGWCLDREGDVDLAVVEVHNTYGERHAYPLRPDAAGRATVDKAMYVSPFHGVDGSYEVVVPVPSHQLDLRVGLRTEQGARFSAALTGRECPSPPWWAPLASLRDAARIRIHGIKLWARRLPIQPRPPHHQEALQ
ncbi:MAG: DUF1365 domain-containing protein [Marmoricola sp.]